MSNFSQFAGGGGIKSLQRGSIVLNASAPTAVTVSAVDTSKSVLIVSTCASVATELLGLTLTNSTTITPVTATGGTPTGITRAYWQLVEYN